MFKYDLNQKIYYLGNGRILSAPITSRMYVENLHDDFAHTDAQKKTWQPFGVSGIFYATIHGIFPESKIFTSKEELISDYST